MTAARQQRRFASRRGALRAVLAAAVLGQRAAAAPALPASPPGAMPPLIAKPLKVVIFALVPYGMPDAAGQPSGVLVELQKQLAQESGLPMEMQLVPYPRAMAMVAAGDADLVFSFPNQQLQQHARALGAIASGDVVVIGRAGSRYATAADLRGKKLAHIRGALYDAQLQSDPGIGRYEAISYEQMVKMLLEGRFDAVLGARLSILHTLRLLGVPREKLGPELAVGKRDILVHYADQRYDPQVAARLERALAAMRARGAAAALLKPYGDGRLPPP
ncbi:substrate-binding periplasmic protein [Pseudoduganella sp. UC29_71]|jgi:ABC-type amino acid transport substrate-binding protein|uniref:substrate-binding periplasmic protein n=1 Tax=Pseudoduganella sp. UC29_71 TaxID=3350174 RepID=UPI00366CE01D